MGLTTSAIQLTIFLDIDIDRSDSALSELSIQLFGHMLRNIAVKHTGLCLGVTNAFFGLIRLFMEDDFENAIRQLASRDTRQSAKKLS